VTEPAVYQWIKAGMPVAEKGSRGSKAKATQLDLEACMRWYFSENFERLELERARARLANEQADAAALKNSESRGELVRLPLVEKIFGMTMPVFKANTLAIPSKLAPELAGLSAPEIKAVLDREAAQLLEGFASFDLRAEQDPDGDAPGAAAREAAAAADD